MNLKNNLKKYWDKYVLVIILLYGSILRLLYLGKMPMWIDETISASAMKAILNHGYPLLESGSTYFRAWLFSYLSAPFVWLFGIDVGSRMVSVIFGVLTIYLAYLFGRKFISKKFGGIAFAALMAISILEIIYSKQARFYQMFQFFYFLSFYLFFKFVILKETYFSKKWLDYVSLVISFLICINTQIMGYIAIPIFAGIYLIYNYKKLLRNKWALSGILILIILGVVYLINSMTLSFIKELVSIHGDHYISYLFRRSIIILLFLGGFIYALIKDRKFALSFGMYFILPFIGLFFVKTFGTRYVYFAFFGLLFYIIYLIDKTKFKWLVLILFISLNLTMVSFNGLEKVNYDISMPWADWKPAYEYASNSTLPVVSTWTPAAYVYGSADYWLKYSISGHSNEIWMLSDDLKTEKFVNATLINSISDLPSEFILILDSQAIRKLTPTYRNYFDLNCEKVFSAQRIDVLNCSS